MRGQRRPRWLWVLLGILAVFVLFVVVTVVRLQHVHHYAKQVRHQGWLSGVYAGHKPADDETFAPWRGAAIPIATDFMGPATWLQFKHPLVTLLAWRYDKSVRLVLSVPMWPTSGGSLGDVAAGKYNGYYNELAKSLVQDGRGDTVIRLGWEFNTPYFRWQVKTPAQARLYAEGWRQAVRSMRSVVGQHFEFVWNPDVTDQGIDPALGYPGDAYVDDIGLDVYDYGTKSGETAAQRWFDLVNQKVGLQWQARFAASHHKPVAFPEWGLVQDPGSDTDGGDDPGFIRHMHAWFGSHHTSFETYFDAPSANGAAFNIDGSDFPAAAKVYRKMFGQP
ncbi:MAG: glycosyl hydrolase [Mycobacteriales bacterium]